MEEDFVPITPINFFHISANCHYWPMESEGRTKLSKLKTAVTKLTAALTQKFLLPDTSNACSETPFAHVYAGWNEQGLTFFVTVNSPIHNVAFPNIADGDSIELFLDTRDGKSGGFNTRFCHHFFFLPESVEGTQAGEITRFRTEDSHPHCDPNDLKMKTKKTSSGYQAEIFIPSHCLTSYDPGEFTRLGFTYRINRSHGTPQHFSMVTDDYQIDQNPSGWGTLRLIQ